MRTVCKASLDLSEGNLIISTNVMSCGSKNQIKRGGYVEIRSDQLLRL